MICPKCEKLIDDNSIRCPFCEYNLISEPDEIVIDAIETEEVVEFHGLGAIFNDICHLFNKLFYPVIVLIVNSSITPSLLFFFSSLITFSIHSLSLREKPNFLVFIFFIFIKIINYLIHYGFVTEVSKKLQFPFGYSNYYSREKSLIIILSLFIESILLIPVYLVELKNTNIIIHIISFIIFLSIFPISISSLLYKEFKSDMVVRFGKKIFIRNLILVIASIIFIFKLLIKLFS